MKRLVNVLLLVLGLSILLPSCQKAPYLTVSGPKSFTFKDAGGSQTFTFSANRDWKVTPSDSWVRVSPSSGSASDGEVTVTITCEPNTTYDPRNTTLNVKVEELMETISVSQETNYGIIVPTKSYDLTSSANTIEVELQANVQYTVSVSDSWIKQTGTKALNRSTLVFGIEENNSYDGRSATITIKSQTAGVPDQVVTVRQAQKDAMTVKNTNFSLPYGGGGVEVKVESNVSFEVTPDVDWIHYVSTKALSNSTVSLNVDENRTFASRTGKVVIKQKNGNLSHTVTINQAGMIAVTSLTLDKTSLTLPEGESATLTATVKPDNATDKSVTWSSSNTSVAKVDGNGKVTAVRKGEATITAKAGEKTQTCKVTVYIPVTSIQLDMTTLTLEEGESATLIATVKPDNATDKSVKWSSSNTSVATVDANGKVLAVKAGTTTIIAKAGEKQASCEITVNKKVIQVTSVTLDKENLTIVVGNQSTLKATVEPNDATDKTVTWTSSNTSVATVENGVVKGVGTGSVMITASAGDQSATCNVIVIKDSADGVSAKYYGGAMSIINGKIQSGSQLNFGIVNYSTETIRVVSVQLIDGQTGNGGNVMSIGADIASGASSAWTLTIGAAGIYEPKARFVYTFKGETYTCEAKYTAPNWGF